MLKVNFHGFLSVVQFELVLEIFFLIAWMTNEDTESSLRSYTKYGCILTPLNTSPWAFKRRLLCTCDKYHITEVQNMVIIFEYYFYAMAGPRLNQSELSQYYKVACLRIRRVLN